MLKSNLNHLNLLYLSNDKKISMSLKNTLNIVFKNVLIVDNLTYGYESVEKHNIDIILASTFDNNFKSYEILKKIRHENPQIAIIIMSTFKNEDILLKCIKMQIFDFLDNPIKMEELIYTLNKVSRNFSNYNQEIVIFNKNYKYSYTTKEVYSNGKIIALTKNESRLVELLISKQNIPTSRNEIELHIWNNTDITDSTFKSLIKRVRNKLGTDTLKNSPGHGYFLT